MKDTFSKIEVRKVYPRAWDDHRVFWTVYSDPAKSRADAYLGSAITQKEAWEAACRNISRGATKV